MFRRIILIVTTIFMSSCLKGPGFFKQSSASLSTKTVKESTAEVLSDENGVITAAFSASSNSIQIMTASADSAIAGTQLSFPPGSLALNANIVVQEGVSLASASFSSDVGLDPSNALVEASSTVVISTDVAMDAANPFTLAIPYSKASLNLNFASVNFAVLYSVFVAAENKSVAGVIPLNQLTVGSGTVSFAISHFGAYQLVTTSVPVVDKVEVATAKPIVTKAEVAQDPLTVDSYKPYAVASGKKVTLTGTNFRPSMTVALGTKAVSDLSVQSDSAATFTMPDSVPFGFADLIVAQDGVVEKGRLFALAAKTNLPLMTVAESGVCAGVSYYDANGDKKTGTKDCSGGADNMLKSAYDANANGKADQADSATVAVSASSASSAMSASVSDWAKGKAGTSITLAGTGALTLPGDGSFYSVSGGGTINGLSPADSGTKVTLKFSGTFTLVDSSTLVLNSPTIAVKTGDVVELQAISGTAWREINRSIRKSVVTATCGACSQVIYNETNPYSPSGTPDVLDFSTETTDFLGEFSNAHFIPAQDGTYEVSVSARIQNGVYPANYCSSSKSAVLVYNVDNAQVGSAVVSDNALGHCTTGGIRQLTDTRKINLQAGHSFSIGIYHFNTTVTAHTDTASIDPSNTSLSIVRVD